MSKQRLSSQEAECISGTKGHRPSIPRSKRKRLPQPNKGMDETISWRGNKVPRPLSWLAPLYGYY